MADRTPRIKPYNHPAGGWGAAAATARVLMQQSVLTKGSRALLSMNQPGGFKCPSCAYPDAACTKRLEFCENGAKALAFEATKLRADRDFFAKHSVTEMAGQSDHWLEMQGRLTEPMRYDAASDHYVPISWDDAFALIGQHLRALDDPNHAAFYTSGRTPNEAAFLWAILGRSFGTNNFPDCSNMCHAPTSEGLPPAIGIGKGTCVMEDWDHAEAIFILGQNPGTNSPRMMTNLVEARKRGAPIIAVNPMPERALIEFTEPQDVIQMARFGHTDIASDFLQIRIGGDLAFLKGMMRALFERDAAGEAVLDHDFIRDNTAGFDALRADVMIHDWPELVAACGLTEAKIRECADIYAKSNATMIAYGMGITQHQRGTELVQQISNLLLLRGNYGKPGAGIVPVRGHSNVQGDRTVGINEKPTDLYLDRVRDAFGFEPPRAPGHNTVETVAAMEAGTVRVFIGLGGNFVRAVPDTERAYRAMESVGLTVGIATKLNRGHVIHGTDALILPVIARSEVLATAKGEQFVTIEDAMANVTASRGVLTPASPDLLGEVEIVCRIAQAAVPDSPVRWADYAQDYSLIRDKIAEIYPEIYTGFNQRIAVPTGFHLDVPPRQRIWNTPNKRANFLILPGLHANDPVADPGMLRLATIRSHDQFNTTIYSENDRYRGVYGDRMVLFMNAEDMAERGLSEGAVIGVETLSTDGATRRVEGLSVVRYSLPRGAVAGYYPELNPLLPLYYFDPLSGTPAAKSIPVKIVTG